MGLFNWSWQAMGHMTAHGSMFTSTRSFRFTLPSTDVSVIFYCAYELVLTTKSICMWKMHTALGAMSTEPSSVKAQNAQSTQLVLLVVIICSWSVPWSRTSRTNQNPRKSEPSAVLMFPFFGAQNLRVFSMPWFWDGRWWGQIRVTIVSCSSQRMWSPVLCRRFWKHFGKSKKWNTYAFITDWSMAAKINLYVRLPNSGPLSFILMVKSYC